MAAQNSIARQTLAQMERIAAMAASTALVAPAQIYTDVANTTPQTSSQLVPPSVGRLAKAIGSGFTSNDHVAPAQRYDTVHASLPVGPPMALAPSVAETGYTFEQVWSNIASDDPLIQHIMMPASSS